MSALLASRSRALVVGLIAAGALVACGPSTKGGGPGGNNPDGRGGGTDDPDADNGSGGGAVDAPPCASMPHKAQAAPLDMYIMLDQSGSMQGTKWTQVTSGLKQFVQQPNLDGFAVGLQYFGVEPGGSTSCPTTCTQSSDCGTGNLCFQNLCLCLGGGGGDSCTASDYATPEVEIAPLPGASSTLVASINAHSPTTGTPTSAALQGAIDHASSWGTAHPGDVTVVVLATDGEPEECDTNLTNIDNIAATGVAGNPKILTFVIGVGSSLSNLNGIAAAGGTTSAFIVDTSGNIGQQFLDALNMIRGSVLGCRYTIPLPTSGNPDFAHVTVTYTPSGGGATQTLTHVNDANGCTGGQGWYYDDNASPTQIVLCQTTCGTVSADKAGEVDIDTPCSVVVN
jgi:uncharacterized protein YegL